jgi:heat shock protein HslJ
MSTRKACPNMSGESEYTNSLAGDLVITVEQGLLVLSRDGERMLTFKKK